MTSVCLHQPNFMPWTKLLAKIAASDVYVAYDTVQFTRTEYHNRQRPEHAKEPRCYRRRCVTPSTANRCALSNSTQTRPSRRLARIPFAGHRAGIPACAFLRRRLPADPRGVPASTHHAGRLQPRPAGHIPCLSRYLQQNRQGIRPAAPRRQHRPPHPAHQSGSAVTNTSPAPGEPTGNTSIGFGSPTPAWRSGLNDSHTPPTGNNSNRSNPTSAPSTCCSLRSGPQHAPPADPAPSRRCLNRQSHAATTLAGRHPTVPVTHPGAALLDPTGGLGEQYTRVGGNRPIIPG